MRNETSCSAEVQWGNTIVIAVVSCRIIAPFMDKANEGVLHFNTELSAQAEVTGYSHAEISRLLEKSIRESETLDTESLCIVNGEKVWEIRCEVRIVDASGGNIIDASVLASMAALKGFRKPEISVTTTEIISQKESQSKLIIHHSDERDPLPLALHHTPLTISLGVFRKGGQSQSGEKFEVRKKYSIRSCYNFSFFFLTLQGKEKYLLVVDPSSQEESSMDGIISFSINSFR
jgi:exosome complex RNA-binding protein Rrp42 (RNase PH superfamily)